MSISATVEINRNVTATVDTGRGPVGPIGPQGPVANSYSEIAALPGYPSSFPNATVANASSDPIPDALVKFDPDGSLGAITINNPLIIGGGFSGNSTFDALLFSPESNITPAISGQAVFQRTSNTQLTLKLRGSDGTIRSGNLNLSTGGSTYLVAGNNLSDLQSASAARTALSVPGSDPTGVTGADAITNIISLTQAEYDAIGVKSATTLYVIT